VRQIFWQTGLQRAVDIKALRRGKILASAIVGGALVFPAASLANLVKTPTPTLTSQPLAAEAAISSTGKGFPANTKQAQSTASVFEGQASHLLGTTAVSAIPAPADQKPSSDLQAQVPPAKVQQFLLRPIPPELLLDLTRNRSVSGGSSTGSPTAYGASQGQAFVATSFQARTRFNNRSDGGISAGVGLGNPRNLVGLETTFAVTNLFGNGAGTSSISFKVHHVFPENFAAAVGVENAIQIGDARDTGLSVYGVVSKSLQLRDSVTKPFSSLTASVGVGSGRFRRLEEIGGQEVFSESSVGVFGSLGVRVAEPVTAIVDWTGQDLTLGASFLPFRRIPLVITPAVADITGSAGDGARFILGIGYAFNF